MTVTLDRSLTLDSGYVTLDGKNNPVPIVSGDSQHEHISDLHDGFTRKTILTYKRRYRVPVEGQS